MNVIIIGSCAFDSMEYHLHDAFIHTGRGLREDMEMLSTILHADTAILTIRNFFLNMLRKCLPCNLISLSACIVSSILAS